MPTNNLKVTSRTPFLTNIRSKANEAAKRGSEVYYAGNKGEEQPTQDEDYEFSYYPKKPKEVAAPPGQMPNNDEDLDFFVQRRKFREKAYQEIGGNPYAIDSKQEANRIATEAMKTKDPVFRIMGPQTKEDYRWLQQTFADAYKLAENGKKEKTKMLEDLLDRFDTNYDEERKHRRAREEERLKAEGKFPTEDERLERALTERLGRKPTNQEFIDFKQDQIVGLERQKAEAKAIAKDEKGPSMTQEKTVMDTLKAALGEDYDLGLAYGYYRQYLKNGFDAPTALRHAIAYTKYYKNGKYIGKTILPAKVIASLKEGKRTTFKNGQVWTLEQGEPTRLK